jgi:hypothetical protein
LLGLSNSKGKQKITLKQYFSFISQWRFSMNNISVHRFVYYVLYYSPKTGGKLGRILELILEMLVLHHISKVVKQNLDIESAVYEAAAYLYTLRSYLSNCRQYLQKNWQTE